MPHVHQERIELANGVMGNRYRLRDGKCLLSDEFEKMRNKILQDKSDVHPHRELVRFARQAAFTVPLSGVQGREI